MTGTMRAPRSRGMLSGLLLILLGLWGGLIPFVGPYTDFAFTPDKAWHVTDERLLFHVAPAVATVLGGLIVLAAANRAFGVFGAWLAALGGAWFVVGMPLGVLWDSPGVGTPLGAEGRQVAEQLSFFSGLGVFVIFFAALALGRFAVVGVKDVRLAEEMAEHDARRDEPRDRDREPEPGPAPRPTVPEQAAARRGTDTGPDDDRGSNVTQPLPRHQGRYARAEPTSATDERVAGKTGGQEPRH